MICRIWRGWTKPENADGYESLLRSEIFPGILAKNIDGFLRIDLYRRPDGREIEFMTAMWFDSLDAVKRFAGPEWEKAVVPPPARALLSRFDDKSRHYDMRERRDGGGA